MASVDPVLGRTVRIWGGIEIFEDILLNRTL
jgi:hypothetical protein